MRILLTGGTGLIGRALCRRLLAQEHQLTVLSRRPDSVATQCGAGVAAMAALDEWTPERTFDAVINLAGEGIFDARWSEARKRKLWNSRVDLTEQLVERMSAAQQRPQALISGSATGYYGNGGDVVLGESAPAGNDFGARLCAAWEAAAQRANELGVRVCLVRTGLVLSPEGGLLGRMLPAFRLGAGARLGSGAQWMAWIHMDDYVRAVECLLTSSAANGPFNLTAPNPVTNSEFTATLSKVLRRPAWLVAPAGVLGLLLGEMAELMLGGQRAVPERLAALGFNFQSPDLPSTLESLLGHR